MSLSTKAKNVSSNEYASAFKALTGMWFPGAQVLALQGSLANRLEQAAKKHRLPTVANTLIAAYNEANDAQNRVVGSAMKEAVIRVLESVDALGKVDPNEVAAIADTAMDVAADPSRLLTGTGLNEVSDSLNTAKTVQQASRVVNPVKQAQKGAVRGAIGAVAKEVEDMKSGKTMNRIDNRRQSYKNNPLWWSKADESGLSVNFGRPLGIRDNSEITFDTVEGVNMAAQGVASTVPFVRSLYITPTVVDMKQNDGFVLASIELFQFLRQSLKSNLAYSVTDVQNYLAEVAAFSHVMNAIIRDCRLTSYAQIKNPQLLTVCNQYNTVFPQQGVYMPSQLSSQAAGTPPCFSSELAQTLSILAKYGESLQLIPVPWRLHDWSKWMYNAVYEDEDNAAGQLYVSDTFVNLSANGVLDCLTSATTAADIQTLLFNEFNYLQQEYGTLMADMWKSTDMVPLFTPEEVHLCEKAATPEYNEAYFNMLINSRVLRPDQYNSFNPSGFRIDSMRKTLLPSSAEIVSMAQCFDVQINKGTSAAPNIVRYASAIARPVCQVVPGWFGYDSELQTDRNFTMYPQYYSTVLTEGSTSGLEGFIPIWSEFMQHVDYHFPLIYENGSPETDPPTLKVYELKEVYNPTFVSPATLGNVAYYAAASLFSVGTRQKNERERFS